MHDVHIFQSAWAANTAAWFLSDYTGMKLTAVRVIIRRYTREEIIEMPAWVLKAEHHYFGIFDMKELQDEICGFGHPNLSAVFALGFDGTCAGDVLCCNGGCPNYHSPADACQCCRRHELDQHGTYTCEFCDEDFNAVSARPIHDTTDHENTDIPF